MKIISRSEAKNLGEVRYFTGEPCKNGHIAERFTTSGNCVECMNTKRRVHPPGFVSRSYQNLTVEQAQAFDDQYAVFQRLNEYAKTYAAWMSVVSLNPRNRDEAVRSALRQKIAIPQSVMDDIKRENGGSLPDWCA